MQGEQFRRIGAEACRMGAHKGDPLCYTDGCDGISPESQVNLYETSSSQAEISLPGDFPVCQRKKETAVIFRYSLRFIIRIWNCPIHRGSGAASIRSGRKSDNGAGGPAACDSPRWIFPEALAP